ncbi:NAD-dependent epimerase/dehydratase family protein [Candidatus Neomarinimicrobiota bacterium]
MKILVAGGAGYLGSRLVPNLLDHGYQVTVIDLLWFGSTLPEGANVIQKDVFDINEADLQGIDRVIFLAGLSNDPMADYSPSMNFISNASGPSYLAFIAKRAGVSRFIYADSCSIYGYTVNELYDEESPTTSTYPYGISKLQGEFGVMQLADDNFSVICLRQGTVSGYSPRMRFDLIVNTMFMTAMTENKITVNNPAIWRPILGMRDATNAYLRAIQADMGISGVFNVASGNYTVGEVGDSVWSYVKDRHGTDVKLMINDLQDFRNYKVSNQKVQDILGVRFQDTIESILNDLNARFDSAFDYNNDIYYNIRVFRKIFSADK